MAGPKDKYILLAEDDKPIAEVIKIILEDEGLKSVQPDNYADLLRKIAQPGFGLVLLDVNLWGNDGLAIFKMIRQNPLTKDTPIILLSAKTDTLSLAWKIGANDVLEKPFDVDNLIKKIRKHL